MSATVSPAPAREDAAPQDRATPAGGGRTARRGGWDAPLGVGILAIGCLWCAVLLWQSRHYVPMWDARIYAVCAVSAAVQPFSLAALRCAGHPSEAYMGVLSLVQRLDPGDPILLHATNALLLALAAAAFVRLLRATFPMSALAPERALLVVALLLDPGVLSSVLHVNVDTGVFVFLLCAVAALVEDRRWTAALFGLLACYSKEAGALLYTALVGCAALAALLPRPVPPAVRNALALGALGALLPALLVPWGPWSVPLAAGAALAGARVGHGRSWRADELRAIAPRLLPLAPLALPTLVYALQILWPARGGGGALWGGISSAGIAQLVLTPHLGPYARAYAALVLVLSFHWVMAAVIGADLVAGVRRYARRDAPRVVVGAAPDRLLPVLLFAVAGVYLVTRFESLIMVRYVTPVFPYLLVATLAALLRLRVPPTGRRALLGGLVLLLALSNRRTFDPVSRAVFGSYPVGRHAMLHVHATGQEGPGYGLNQTVYNLEFLRFAELVQAGLDRLHPVLSRRLGVPGPAALLTVGTVDGASQRRLWGPRLAVPTVLHTADVMAGLVRADTLWFLDVPYANNIHERADLARLYAFSAPDSVWVDGYAMGIHRLTRRSHPSAQGAAPTAAPALR